jgi:hypothetical protein
MGWLGEGEIGGEEIGESKRKQNENTFESGRKAEKI